MTCADCGDDIHVGDFPFCHGEKGKHQPVGGAIVPNDIPGGILIEHGLCNPDGTPRRYYSKSEINAEAKRRGLVNFVRHVPGSSHTIDFGAGIDPYTLRNAEILAARGAIGPIEPEVSAPRRERQKHVKEVARHMVQAHG